MTGYPTVQAINAFASVEKSSPGELPQPNLTMTWAIDPVSGKLAARWHAKRAEAAGTIESSSAA